MRNIIINVESRDLQKCVNLRERNMKYVNLVDLENYWETLT